MNVLFIFSVNYLAIYCPYVCCSITNVDRNLDSKLIQGVPIRYYPFMAVVFGQNSGGYGSGSILSSWWVLTVAHIMCDSRGKVVEHDTSLIIAVGTSSALDAHNSQAQRIQSEKVHTYTNYPGKLFGLDDIALVKVERQIIFYPNSVEKIHVYKGSSLRTEMSCIGLGYGVLSKEMVDHDVDALLKKNVWVVKRSPRCIDEVEVKFGNRVDNWLYVWPQEGIGSCLGDSGGPVMCNDTLIGIIVGQMTFGNVDECSFKDANRKKCGTADIMTIIMELCHYHGWIRNHTRADKEFVDWPDVHNCMFVLACSTKPNISVLLGLVCFISMPLIKSLNAFL